MRRATIIMDLPGPNGVRSDSIAEELHDLLKGSRFLAVVEIRVGASVSTVRTTAVHQ